MNGTKKFKCLIAFSALKNEKEAKCQLELFEHYCSISLPALSTNKKDIIKNLFAPIYTTANGSLHINYSFIKHIKVHSDLNVLQIDIFNPVIKIDLSFTLKKMESIGLVFTKTLPLEGIKRIVSIIEQRITKETKHLIKKFLLLLSLLKDCLDPQRDENQQIENILLQAYMTGKSYYEKYTIEYKNNLKIKNGIKNQLNEKLKMLDSMMSEEEQMKRNLTCACFDSLINEFKIRTSYFVEESIMLFFHILSVEINLIDLKIVDNTEVSSNLKIIHHEDNMNHHHHNHLSMFNPMNNSNSNDNSKNMNMSANNNNNESINNSKNNMSLSEVFYNKNKTNSFSIAQNKANKSSNGVFEFNNNQALAHLTILDNDRDASNSNNYNNQIEGMNIVNKVFMNDNTTVSMSSTKNTSNKKKQQRQREKYSYTMNNNKDMLETPKFYSNNTKPYNKYNNKNANGIIGSEKNNSNKKKDNNNNNYIANSLKQSEDSMTMIEIMKQIDELTISHSFVPPVDVYNIFINTSEIIHRTFFELCFETFLGRIFTYETDNDNLIKIDSLYNYFLYLRGMKNFIFSEKNKLYFSSMLFLAEDLK